MALIPYIPIYLQFSSLFAPYNVSNSTIRCQLIQRITFQGANFIGLFNFEWHSQNKASIIGILVLWRDREKLY